MRLPRLTEVFILREADDSVKEDGSGGLGGTSGSEDGATEESEEEMNLANAE